MIYSYTFKFRTSSAKTAQVFSDTLSQFFDDGRIQFECYCEPEEGGIWFFGLYGTDDEALFKKDSKVFKAMMDYANVFDFPEDGMVGIDERIEFASLQEFEENFDDSEYESPDDSLNIMCEFSRDEIEQNESVEETVASELTTVTFAPSMLSNVDGDIINDIAGFALEKAEPGENVLVVDDDAIESGEALKMLIMPGMLEAMKRLRRKNENIQIFIYN